MVSLLKARKGMLDVSVMIYKVSSSLCYNATGTTGDQRYALCAMSKPQTMRRAPIVVKHEDHFHTLL